MSARDCSLALTLLLKYQLRLYNFLRLRFQRVHQPRPAHRVTGFQFLGDARRLHHTGQHGVHPLPRRPVNLQQVRVQLFAQNQAAVKTGPIFLECITEYFYLRKSKMPLTQQHPGEGH